MLPLCNVGYKLFWDEYTEQDFREEQFIDYLPVVSDGFIYAYLFI